MKIAQLILLYSKKPQTRIGSVKRMKRVLREKLASFRIMIVGTGLFVF